MNWFDAFTILFVLLMAYIGSKRGLILEIFDIIILVLGTGLTLHLYTHLSSLILSLLKWNKNFASWFSFFFIFLIISAILYLAALIIDKTVKLAVVLKPLNSTGGFFAGLFKSIILIWMVLLMILIIPMKKQDKKFIFSAASSKIVWNMSSVFLDIFDIISPTFVHEYLDKIVKQSSKLMK